LDMIYSGTAEQLLIDEENSWWKIFHWYFSN
jgi:hypothetical protein